MSRPPINEQITFLYTNDLATSANFYEIILGLKLWLDQGSCRIYQVSTHAYLGLCLHSAIGSPPTDQRTDVIFTLVTWNVDEWYEYLKQQGVVFEKPPTLNEKYQIYHCFFRDPNGYLIEIQRFLNLPQ